jgi:hypothetical protein
MPYPRACGGLVVQHRGAAPGRSGRTSTRVKRDSKNNNGLVSLMLEIILNVKLNLNPMKGSLSSARQNVFGRGLIC